MDFLNKLKELLQVQLQVDFARLCHKKQSNMSSYFNGNTTPGVRALEGCLLNAVVARVFDEPPGPDTKLGKKAEVLRNRVVSAFFTEEIEPLWEIAPVPEKKNGLPKSADVYVLYDSGANVLYVGQAKSFYAEVWVALDRKVRVGMRLGSDMKNSRPTFRDLASYVTLYRIENAVLRHNIEALLIRVFINQTHNRNIGLFKDA